MEKILLSPPVVLLVFMVVFFIAGRILRSAAADEPGGERQGNAYACGQRDIRHFVSPSYYKTFSYAFFFTVMHVLVLVVATAGPGTLLMPLAYVGAGLLAMIILFRR